MYIDMHTYIHIYAHINNLTIEYFELKPIHIYFSFNFFQPAKVLILYIFRISLLIKFMVNKFFFITVLKTLTS